jgi:hypothetical protein
MLCYGFVLSNMSSRTGTHVINIEVAQLRDRACAYWALVGDLRERAHFEDPGVDGG